MNPSKITNLDLIKHLESATELFRNKHYFPKEHVEKYLGLSVHRSGFYGVRDANTVTALNRTKLVFNEEEDVTIVIEGFVDLIKEPVNNGAGSLIYTGYGLLEVDGVVIYDGRGSILTDLQIETAYNNQVPIVSQAEAEAGTLDEVRRWTPERVKQAIDALGGSFALTNGSGTTANGTAADVGGVLTGPTIFTGAVNVDWGTTSSRLSTFDVRAGGTVNIDTEGSLFLDGDSRIRLRNTSSSYMELEPNIWNLNLDDGDFDYRIIAYTDGDLGEIYWTLQNNITGGTFEWSVFDSLSGEMELSLGVSEVGKNTGFGLSPENGVGITHTGGNGVGLYGSTDFSAVASLNPNAFAQYSHTKTTLGGNPVDNLIQSPSISEDGYVLSWNETAGEFTLSPASIGDVVGPASATDNALVRFDLTTGKLIQNSGITVDDSNNMGGINQLSIVDRLVHTGDTDTYIAFANNVVNFYAGGNRHLSVDSLTTEVIINRDNTNSSLAVYSSGGSGTPVFRARSSSNGAVLIKTGTAAANLSIGPSTTTYSHIRLEAGVNKTSLVDGDFLYNGTNLRFRRSAESLDLLAPTYLGTNPYSATVLAPSITEDGQVLYWNEGAGQWQVKAPAIKQADLKYSLGTAGSTGVLMINGAGGYVLPIKQTGTISDITVVCQTGTFGSTSDTLTLDIREVTTSSAGLGSDVTSASGASRRTIVLGAGGTAGARFNRTWSSTTVSGAVTAGNGLFIAIGSITGTVSLSNLRVIINYNIN